MEPDIEISYTRMKMLIDRQALLERPYVVHLVNKWIFDLETHSRIQGDEMVTAKQLPTSVRNLRQRMSEQGLTYYQALGFFRALLALHLMQYSKLPIGKQADVLGYASYSDYSIAVFRWFKAYPTQLREALRQQPVIDVPNTRLFGAIAHLPGVGINSPQRVRTAWIASINDKVNSLTMA